MEEHRGRWQVDYRPTLLNALIDLGLIGWGGWMFITADAPRWATGILLILAGAMPTRDYGRR